MKERPILFSASMVRAILGGRKTQTRRVVKPKHGGKIIAPGGPGIALEQRSECELNTVLCPYGQLCDRLWVRETFQPLFADGTENHWETDWKTGKGYAISYPATDCIQEFVDLDDNISSACKPSIHMPRWASRILLEITGVRVERLQEIGEADAEAEGCSVPEIIYPDEPRESYSYVAAYRHLWESINGIGSWDANPWVWVIEFKRVQP